MDRKGWIIFLSSLLLLLGASWLVMFILPMSPSVRNVAFFLFIGYIWVCDSIAGTLVLLALLALFCSWPLKDRTLDRSSKIAKTKTRLASVAYPGAAFWIPIWIS